MMKLLLLFTLTFTAFSTFVSTYEVDFSIEPAIERDAYEKKLYSVFSDSREVLLFATKYEDGFDSVLDNTVKVWSDGKDFRCEYVKVFYWDKKPEAVKLGLKTAKFLDMKRVYDRSVFFLKSNGKWSEVKRKDYFDFLRSRNLPNYAHRTYEKDERFEEVNDDQVIDPVEVALRPTWADLRKTPKPLPKNIVKGVPTEPVVDDKGPFPEPGRPGLDPSGKPHAEDKEVQKPRNLKTEKDSFFISSLLLPALLTGFYIFN